MRIRSYDIMSASEPESCLQIYGERRMAITIAASAAVSIEDANRDIIELLDKVFSSLFFVTVQYLHSHAQNPLKIAYGNGIFAY